MLFVNNPDNLPNIYPLFAISSVCKENNIYAKNKNKKFPAMMQDLPHDTTQQRSWYPDLPFLHHIVALNQVQVFYQQKINTEKINIKKYPRSLSYL